MKLFSDIVDDFTEFNNFSVFSRMCFKEAKDDVISSLIDTNNIRNLSSKSHFILEAMNEEIDKVNNKVDEYNEWSKEKDNEEP